jgi:8-oxo-dGTP diphosphatase
MEISYGEGEWVTPGGHLEPGESVFACAIRETFEETGITIARENLKELGFTEDFFPAHGKHYITCVLIYDLQEITITPKVMEPEKFSSEWKWFPFSDLPFPLFTPVSNALAKFLSPDFEFSASSSLFSA